MDDRRSDRLSVDPGNDMDQHGASEQVVSPRLVVSKPVKLQDARAADAFAGMEDGMEVLLINGDLQCAPGLLLDDAAPLPRPAHGRDDSAAAILNIEEGRLRR